MFFRSTSDGVQWKQLGVHSEMNNIRHSLRSNGSGDRVSGQFTSTKPSTVTGLTIAWAALSSLTESGTAISDFSGTALYCCHVPLPSSAPQPHEITR